MNSGGPSTLELLEFASRISKVGAWSLDVQTNQLTWSEEVFRIHGLPASTVPTLDEVLAFYTDDSRPVITDAIRKAIATGDAWSLELKIRTGQGSLRWVKSMGEAIFQSGSCQRLIGTLQDITSQRDKDRRLRLSQTSIDQSLDAIVHVRQDGTFSYANGAACRMLGYPLLELLQLRLFDIAPDIQEEHWPAYFEKIRADRVQHDVSRNRRKDGSIVQPVDIYKNFFESDEQQFVLVTLRDRSQQKRDRELRDMLFERSNDAQLIYDATGILECNQAAVEMLRLDNKAELFSNHPAVFSPEVQPCGLTSREKRPLMEQTAREAGFHRFDWVHTRKDGEDFLCEVSLTPVQLASGPAFLVVWHDMSDRVQTDRLVRQSQQQLALALSAANLGLWDWDTTTGKVFFSDTFKLQLGYEATEDWDDYNVWVELLHPDDRLGALARVRGYLEGESEIYQSRFRLRAADGSYRWIRSQGQADLNEKGEPVRLIGVHIDITDLIEHERLLEDLNAKLSRSNQALQEFAYTASHDLQSPLRTIAGFAGFLKEDYADRLDDQGVEYIDRIVKGAGRMQRVIIDLLEYSRVESQAKPFLEVNASDVIEESLQSLAASIAESGAKIHVDSMPTIKADSVQLSQVFLNLIGNAIKYRRPGVAPEIHVSYQQQKGFVRFEVADNGLGIEPRHRDRIFELFKRLHTEKAYPGTGIGLAVARRIVARHGGKIGVDSTPGQGSRFWFTLAR